MLLSVARFTQIEQSLVISFVNDYTPSLQWMAVIMVASWQEQGELLLTPPKFYRLRKFEALNLYDLK